MRLEIHRWFALAFVGCAAPAPQPEPIEPVRPAPALPTKPAPVVEPVVARPVAAEPVTPEPVTPEPVTPEPVEPVEPVAAGEPSRDLEVVARLVEPQHTSHCGYFKFVVVMRYEVVRVVAGTYTATDLYAVHSCPELLPTRCRDLPGEQIRKYVAGDVHHLRLRRGKGDGTLVDKFADKTLPRYRSKCFNLVPPA